MAALLPCLVWDQDPAAPRKAGIDRLCPSSQVDGGVKKLTPPRVEYRNNEATASRSPWLDSNGWRILRSPKGRFYYDVAGDAAGLAAVEAYVYGADALIRTDAKGLGPLGASLAFLKELEPADLPGVANIGVVDDGSEAIGEVMNLLSRHNLLYRIVPAPDPKLNLNVRIGSKEFPAADLDDPNRLSHKIRSMLSDERRLLRIYGSEVVVARLTGDARRARLHLINYANRPVQGLRVRVLGVYPKNTFAVLGLPGAKLQDYTVDGAATEFTIAEMNRYAVIDLYAR